MPDGSVVVLVLSDLDAPDGSVVVVVLCVVVPPPTSGVVVVVVVWVDPSGAVVVVLELPGGGSTGGGVVVVVVVVVPSEFTVELVVLCAWAAVKANPIASIAAKRRSMGMCPVHVGLLEAK